MTTAASTTPIFTTTVGRCDENMDDYGPVNVTRSTTPGGDLDNEDWWTPSDPSDVKDNPYGGSPLTIHTSSPIDFTSLLVERKDDDKTPISIAVRIKPSGSDDFKNVNNPDDGSPVFKVEPGTNLPLPEGLDPGDEIEVYVLEPGLDSPLYVTPFGCEPTGE